MTDQKREAFEAWFLAYRKSTWRPFTSEPRKDMPAHWNTNCEMDCWRGWQAATAAERERCALLCDAYNTINNPVRPSDCAAAIRQGGDA